MGQPIISYSTKEVEKDRYLSPYNNLNNELENAAIPATIGTFSPTKPKEKKFSPWEANYKYPKTTGNTIKNVGKHEIGKTRGLTLDEDPTGITNVTKLRQMGFSPEQILRYTELINFNASNIQDFLETEKNKTFGEKQEDEITSSEYTEKGIEKGGIEEEKAVSKSTFKNYFKGYQKHHINIIRRETKKNEALATEEKQEAKKIEALRTFIPKVIRPRGTGFGLKNTKTNTSTFEEGLEINELVNTKASKEPSFVVENIIESKEVLEPEISTASNTIKAATVNEMFPSRTKPNIEDSSSDIDMENKNKEVTSEAQTRKIPTISSPFTKRLGAELGTTGEQKVIAQFTSAEKALQQEVEAQNTVNDLNNVNLTPQEEINLEGKDVLETPTLSENLIIKTGQENTGTVKAFDNTQLENEANAKNMAVEALLKAYINSKGSRELGGPTAGSIKSGEAILPAEGAPVIPTKSIQDFLNQKTKEVYQDLVGV